MSMSMPTPATQASRKVLLIAYIFPPIGGSGVQRTMKFVKYLPQFAWEPIVVCGDDGYVFGDGMDPTLLNDVSEDILVYRRPFVSAYGLRRAAKRKLGLDRDGRQLAYQSEQTQVSTFVEAEADLGAKPKKPLTRRVMGAMAKVVEPIEKPFIDAAAYWALSIVPLCRKLVIEHNIDLIYSTSFPYSDHLTGLLVKRLTGKPWVADFRDPWTLNACARHIGVRRKIDIFAEKQVLQHADKVIAVTPPYTQDFRDLAADRKHSDIVTITNGFDEIDFQMLASQGSSTPLPWSEDKSDKMTIAHVGYVFPGSAIPFLSALRQLGDEARRLRVVFIGGLAASDTKWLQAHPVPVEVQFANRVSHAQAIYAMQSADALLLLIGDGPDWLGHYPGKLFEYMRSGTPILLSGPDGAAAELVRRSGTGYVVPANDGETATRILRRLVTDPAVFWRHHYHPDPTIIARHERKSLTEQLANLFGEVLDSTGS